MKPNEIRFHLWKEMAAVPEVQSMFGLEGLESPTWHLWTKAKADLLDPMDGSDTVIRLSGKDSSTPSTIFLIRREDQMVAVADDDDLGGCELPICDGESLMFSDDDTVACANASCPNFERWF